MQETQKLAKALKAIAKDGNSSSERDLESALGQFIKAYIKEEASRSSWFRDAINKVLKPGTLTR